MSEWGASRLGHWVLLRLAVSSFVLTAGVLLLVLAAEGIPTAPLIGCLIIQYCSVALCALAVRWGVSLERVQAAQLGVDLGIIAVCVHFSGGVHSKFVPLYFFPVLLAAYELKQRGALYVAALASSLMLGYALLVSAGRLHAPEIEYRSGVVSNGALFESHVVVLLLLVVGYLAGELAGRVSVKTAELEQRTQELALSQRETRSILDNMGSGVLTLDRRGIVQRLNPAAERILGARSEELIGRSVSEGLGAIMPIFVGHLMEGVVDSTTIDRTEVHVEREDGVRIPLGLNVNLLHDGEGQSCGVVAVFQDLSSVVKMRDRMRSNDRLAAMGELSATIAHEIRNPLASIRGSVEMLQNELELDAENARLMDLIHRESARLNHIIEDFLDYARLKPLQPRNCRVADLLEDLEGMLLSREELTDRISLAVVRPAEDLVVNVDEELMEQVLLNISLNAIEAMHAQGRLEITTELKPNRVPPEVEIRVQDQGPGIDEGVIERIFEPFFTTKVGGTGLGLPLASRIMGGHEGRLTVRNRPSGGAEFVVHVPLAGIIREGRLLSASEALSADESRVS